MNKPVFTTLSVALFFSSTLLTSFTDAKPNPNPSEARSYKNFRLMTQSAVNGRFPVVIYESSQTGLKVASIQVGGPVVNGYITLATEAHDDDGLPHTLEHLVFMGSEKYPWKGVLDLLANRCLASGTNAWTDVDHTCYTMTTAGSEGFCNLLPIYLDHIFYPTLTDSAYLTEVHHVNDEGEDAGIVYSEMQSRENTGENIIHRTLSKALYPGKSGYKSVTGGILKNLRESTSNKKVRDYHKEFYRPENLWVIVTGKMDPVKILECLDPVEQKLIAKGKNPKPYIRPWMEPVEPLRHSIDMEVPYPADEVEHGLVYFGWQGPSSMFEQHKLTALTVMLDYLTDTAISPIQKEFVEIDSPYASKVSFHVSENLVSAITLSFSDVPMGKLNEISPKLWQVLRNLTEATFDVVRMKSLLHHKMLDFWATLESDPHSALAYDMIGFMLYGNSSQDLTFRLNEDKYYEELMQKPPKFWIDLLREYIDESRPHVVVRGKPSAELETKNAANEANRKESRISDLGPDGLRQNKANVDHAVEANEVQPSDEVITSVPVPSTDGIHYHTIEPYSNFAVPSSSGRNEIRANSPHFDLNSIPVRMRIDDVSSNFVYIHLMIDTAELDPSLRLYLPLFLESISESPLKLPPGIRWHGPNVTSDGENSVTVDSDGFQHVPHELVVAQIEAETQSITSYLGVGGGSVFSAGYFSNYAVISIQVELSKYADGVRWLRDLVYFTDLDPDRIQVLASKLSQSVAQKKRRGDKVVRALITDMDYVKGSNHWAVSMVRQQNLLTEVSQNISKAMEGNNDNKRVVMELEGMRQLKKLQKQLMENTAGFILYMAADLRRLYENNGKMPSEKPWVDTILPYFEQSSVDTDSIHFRDPPKVVTDAMLLARPPNNSALPDPKHATVVGMGSVDSAYLFQTVQTEVNSYTHPDFSSLMLFLQYLEQLEGPIWRAVRGQGLSYSYYFQLSAEEGLILLYLGRSSQVVDAYEVTAKIVREHVSEGFQLSHELFESAKSSLVFGLIEKEQSISDLVNQAALSSFRGVPVSYTKTMIDRIWKVTEEEMMASGRKHMPALFNPAKSRAAIVCHSAKVNEIVQSFKNFGRNMVTYDSAEDSFLNEA